MPHGQREAMYEIYSFCRVVDDIADDEGAAEGRLEKLEEWRRNIDAIYLGEKRAGSGGPGHRRSRISTSTATTSAPSSTAWRWMSGKSIQAPAFVELDLYCDRVASAVGRLSSRVFGLPAEEGRQLSEHLGRALQLTNILRDLDEDAGMGRLYLPREFLNEAGITTTDPASRSCASGAAGGLRADRFARALALRGSGQGHEKPSAPEGAHAARHGARLTRAS